MDKLGLQRFGCFATATRGCGSCVIQMRKPSTVLFHYSFIIYYLSCHFAIVATITAKSAILADFFFGFFLFFCDFCFFLLVTGRE